MDTNQMHLIPVARVNKTGFVYMYFYLHQRENQWIKQSLSHVDIDTKGVGDVLLTFNLNS